MLELTDGVGVDVAIEAVGIPETFELCTEIVRSGGHVANVGVHGKPATLHLERLWIKGVTITTGLVDTSSTPRLMNLVSAGKLDPLVFVTHRFPLEEAEAAYEPLGCAGDRCVQGRARRCQASAAGAGRRHRRHRRRCLVDALTQQAEGGTVDAIACSGLLPRRGARRGSGISPSSCVGISRATLPSGEQVPGGGAGAAVGGDVAAARRPRDVLPGDRGLRRRSRRLLLGERASPSWGRSCSPSSTSWWKASAGYVCSFFGIPLRSLTGPETNVGEAMRYLSELPWAPHAMSANRDLSWREVNARTVEVCMSLDGSTAAVALSFDDAGDIIRATGMRPFRVGKAFVPTPWGGDYSNYKN